jgi:hypothetical protein
MKIFRSGAMALFMMAASAAPSNAFVVTPTSGGSLGTDPNANFTISGLNPGDNFDIDYSFTLSSPTSFSNFTVSLTDSSGQIQSLLVQIWGNGLKVGSPIASGTGAGSPQNASAVASFAPDGTNYFVEVSGVDPAGGPTNLQLSGNTFTTAVPEPGTWALIGMGFACLGLMAYRRRGSGASFRIA